MIHSSLLRYTIVIARHAGEKLPSDEPRFVVHILVGTIQLKPFMGLCPTVSTIPVPLFDPTPADI